MFTPLGARAWAQCEEWAQLLASDADIFDSFGEAVAASGKVAIVGAPLHDDRGSRSGAVYVYRYSGAFLVEEAKLLASDGSDDDRFGAAVSVSGDVALVGAPSGDGDDFETGTAYIYRYDGSTWTEEAKPIASDGEPQDGFGNSLSISGDVAIIGANLDDDNGVDSGAAYVFRYDGGTWVEEAKLVASDGQAGDRYGQSVSVSGTVAVVGAYFRDEDTTDSGAVYVYRFDGRAWVEEAKLVESDEAPGYWFGAGVSISGDLLAVGASLNGFAYVYRYDGSNWLEETKLVPFEGQSGGRFGWSVSIRGDVALVGAYRRDDEGSESGAAYLYLFDGSTWVPSTKLVSSDLSPGDRFGYSVSVGGGGSLATDALVGALANDASGTGAGAAYIFRDVSGPDCNENSVPDGCDIALETSEDCDGDEVPDECQVDLFVTSSPPLGPVGHGVPLQFVVPAPPEAGVDGVLVAFTVSADLSAESEWIDVLLNEELIGTVFRTDGEDCADPSDEAQFVLEADTYNALLGGGDAVFDLVASFAVDPELCPNSFITIEVEYFTFTDDDCNGNGIPDICDILSGELTDENGNWIPDECEDLCPADLDGDGAVGFGDVLAVLSAWGECADCREDLDDSGTVDFADLLILLAAWGPCPK